MKFAIRDDDTNYLTKPEDIERIYGDIWDVVPISLAVVPFVYTKKDIAPYKYWSKSKEYPIGENKKLVAFLKGKIKDGKISLMLHGYNHKIYKGRSEFEAGDNLFERTKEGKEYLESIFDIKIRCFVPPYNRISYEGLNAIIENGLNLVTGYPISPIGYYIRDPSEADILLKQLYYRLYHRSKYPHLIEHKKYRELLCTTLTANTSLEQLKNSMELARKEDGVFCIATHIDEMCNWMKWKLDYIINLVKEYGNTEFCSVNKIFERKNLK